MLTRILCLRLKESSRYTSNCLPENQLPRIHRNKVRFGWMSFLLMLGLAILTPTFYPDTLVNIISNSTQFKFFALTLNETRGVGVVWYLIPKYAVL